MAAQAQNHTVTSSGSPSLRDKQINAVKRMLNLNNPLPKSQASNAPLWKVLIYDKFGQDIISPLLSVKELRDQGVTLHLLIAAEREPIQDSPAVYFIQPTVDNIRCVCRDMKNQLYHSYYFNFLSPISRNLLEDLAKGALDASVAGQVTKVYDQYLNFISLEDDLFIARHEEREAVSYYALNTPDVKDTDIQYVRDMLVDSLFAMLATAGTIPVIRCPRGNAAEMIAESLDKKLRDNLRDSRNNVFTGENVTFSQLSLHRPLLVILDRGIDLATPMHHTWTYQALAHDVLDLTLNRVQVTTEGEVGGEAGRVPLAKQKTYDLSPKDIFWKKHKGSPFPNVADSIQSELEEYKQSEEEVSKLKVAMGVSEEDDPEVVQGSLADNTAKLTSAVSSLPELLEKKKRIDTHTNIAMAILEHIKSRKLDTFFEMEEKLLTKATVDKSAYLDLVKDPLAGSPEDKMRLFAIYYILAEISDADVQDFMSALESCGADLKPFQYLKSWKAFTKMAGAPRAKLLGSSTTSSSMTGVFTKLMSTGSKFVMEGVKNLVIRSQNLPVTRIVEQLAEHRSSKETEDYRYFDPKMLKSTDSSIPKSKTPFQEIIVFIVGGGNYIEYQNLQDYSKRAQPQKKILYGTSDMISADEFLHQLSRLGERFP